VNRLPCRLGSRGPDERRSKNPATIRRVERRHRPAPRYIARRASADADLVGAACSRRHLSHEVNVNAVWLLHPLIGGREREWYRRLAELRNRCDPGGAFRPHLPASP
jgi:hypothetical protein